jgi:pimeloyl-ACP methyl ester carboxylesterase
MAEITANGVRLHVQQIGVGAGRVAGDSDRPVVVFIHGLVMDNLSSWYFSVATAVAREADVLLYDLRGHGMSERPARGYTLTDQVADLAAMLEGAGVRQPVHLVGNSFGGLVALAYARHYPRRTAGVVLVDGHLGTEGFGAMMAGTLRLQGAERDQKIADSFKDWLGRHSERKRTRLADNARALIEGTTLVDDMQATPPLGSADIAAVTHLGGVPVLAIYGERSDLRASAEGLLGGRAGVHLEIVPGCSHSVLWEATNLVRDRVLQFVARAVRQAA